ncbi:MAG: hypothetical protein B6I28_00955 [Fusobacteriia bacterium 4572_132]|nr:MAG: hypothetical protein B6I28_00955 [Fusobacteriia bacterium 4572_132]
MKRIGWGILLVVIVFSGCFTETENFSEEENLSNMANKVGKIETEYEVVGVKEIDGEEQGVTIKASEEIQTEYEKILEEVRRQYPIEPVLESQVSKKRASNLSEADLINLMKREAIKYTIPYEIIYGIASQESRLRQFRNGAPLISGDGGIGIMQVTPWAVSKKFNDYSLKNSTEYNLSAGCQVLLAKRRLIKNYWKNPIGDMDNRILETWYNTIWAYNGYSKINNPMSYINGPRTWGNSHISWTMRETYQDMVYGKIKKGLGIEITPIPSNLFPKAGTPKKGRKYQIPVPYRISESFGGSKKEEGSYDGGNKKNNQFKIEAENYDYGKEGESYHDEDSENKGKMHRNDGVDIEKNTNGGYNVAFIKKGEWLKYSDIKGNGQEYKVYVNVASGFDREFAFHLEINGQELESIHFEGTDGWQSWNKVYYGNVILLEEKNEVKFISDSDGFNLDSIEFEEIQKSFSKSVNENGNIVVEAENFDYGIKGVAYNDIDSENKGGVKYRNTGVDIEACKSGGYNVAFIKSGEWLNYSEIKGNGEEYTIYVNVASGKEGKHNFRLELNDQVIVDNVNFESTNGWQEWEKIKVGSVIIKGNENNLKFIAESDDFNLDSIEFIKKNTEEKIEENKEEEENDYVGGESFKGGNTNTEEFIIEAEDYDKGDQGIAYSDTTEENKGKTDYREGSVDVEKNIVGGYDVGFIKTGEWLQYSEIKGNGKYDVFIDVASGKKGQYKLYLEVNGEKKDSIEFSDTDGWQKWKSISAGKIELKDGKNTIKIVAESNDFNIDLIKFKKVPVAESFKGGNTKTEEFVIEAENYDKGGEGLGYSDTSEKNEGMSRYRNDSVDIETCINGGYNIAFIKSGEWLQYSDIKGEGNYKISMDVASGKEGNYKLHLEINGEKINSVEFSDTDGWQKWKNVEIGEVLLSGDKNIVKVIAESDDFNIDDIKFQKIVDENNEPETSEEELKIEKLRELTVAVKKIDNLDEEIIKILKKELTTKKRSLSKLIIDKNGKNIIKNNVKITRSGGKTEGTDILSYQFLMSESLVGEDKGVIVYMVTYLSKDNKINFNGKLIVNLKWENQIWTINDYKLEKVKSQNISDELLKYSDVEMPSPFTKVLYYDSENMVHGEEVKEMQNMLNKFFKENNYYKEITVDGWFGNDSRLAVLYFQRYYSSLNNGAIFDPATAKALIEKTKESEEIIDIKENEFAVTDSRYKFNIIGKFSSNRTREGRIYIYSKDGELKISRRALANGAKGGMNTSGGDTPTGVYDAGLERYKTDSTVYGKGNVVRLIKGIDGLAKRIYGYGRQRNGILIHGGRYYEGKNYLSKTYGCVRVFDPSQREMFGYGYSDGGILNKSLGVTVSRPYTFKVQGRVEIRNQ